MDWIAVCQAIFKHCVGSCHASDGCSTDRCWAPAVTKERRRSEGHQPTSSAQIRRATFTSKLNSRVDLICVNSVTEIATQTQALFLAVQPTVPPMAWRRLRSGMNWVFCGCVVRSYADCYFFFICFWRLVCIACEPSDFLIR